MSPLDTKLLRDIWRLRMYAAGIVIVLGCGLAVLIMAIGMRDSLLRTLERYYDDQRMADLAVSLVRAPDRLAGDLANVTGVSGVETRITGYALIDLDSPKEPVSARLISVPRHGRPKVNDLVLSAGRWPDPNRSNEVLINEGFASALNLRPGSTLDLTLHGHHERVFITGTANSPEFIFVSAPGEMFPQPERFAIIWMNRDALGQAYNRRGAFNEAVFKLSPGTDLRIVSSEIDALLRRYGSAGVHGREQMMSDRFLREEIDQLAILAAFIPGFFLLVAAFLVNVSMSRVIATERSNIGLLKSFGYSNNSIAWHYAKSALIFAILGFAAGIAGGVIYGRFTAEQYRSFYHFPTLEFSASSNTYALAAFAAVAAASLGASSSVIRAASLAPAAALAPPEPAEYGSATLWIERFGRYLDVKSRIILRRIVRFPLRSASTSLGVSLAISILIVTQTFPAEMTYMLDVHFGVANRQTVTLSLTETSEQRVLHDIEHLPGVMAAEPFRVDAVIFENNGRRVEDALLGQVEGARLNRLIDNHQQVIKMPATGILLSHSLANKLGVRTGQSLTVEQTTGRRARTRVRVAGVVAPMTGGSAYMNLSAQARLMREPGRISGAYVQLDMALYDQFTTAVKTTPALLGASFVSLAERSMRKNFAEHLGLMTSIYSGFAAVMAGGVAFSAARITLAEQQRDLATLRVLGFTRLEASYVLMGEVMVLTLFSLPFAAIFGTGMAIWLTRLFSTETFAFPFVFNPPGYAFAMGFTLLCVLIAALIVRRSVDRLDLVAVLKARD